MLKTPTISFFPSTGLWNCLKILLLVSDTTPDGLVVPP
jgi:hypothetical protein